MDADTPPNGSAGGRPALCRCGRTAAGDGGDLQSAIAGNYYTGDTRWHSDSHSLDYSGVKFTIYLDSLSASSGSLRVIPGSHRQPLWGESKMTHETDAAFGVQADEMPAFAFKSEPGDVLVFLHPLWHSSFGGSTRRRMMEVKLLRRPEDAGKCRGVL